MAASASAKEKLLEAKAHQKAAEKALKLGVMRWKVDYEEAADEFNQAAQCYRIARDFGGCKECLIRAAENYKRSKAFFHAAKSLEKAILIMRDFSAPMEIAEYAKQSAHLYQLNGSGDSAASILDKAATMIVEKNPDQAIILYGMAAEASQAAGGQHQAVEYLSKVSRLLVAQQKYDDAMNNMRVEMGHILASDSRGASGRLCLVMVLVQLARGDLVAAEKVYREWGANCEPPETQLINDLITAWDEEDGDAARRALANPFIKHMDIEYARLATVIRLPRPMHPAERAEMKENAERLEAARELQLRTGHVASAPVPIPAMGSGAMRAAAAAAAREAREPRLISARLAEQILPRGAAAASSSPGSSSGARTPTSPQGDLC